MEASRSTYSYKALDEDRKEFRLLHLHPRNNVTKVGPTTDSVDAVAGGPANTSIHCHLTVASLNDPPPFEALSYAWGDPTATKPIILNGHAFLVTVNLNVALRHLQHSTDERTIWIDALCINQGDLLERTSQVAQMASIFSLASSTIAFLGSSWPSFPLLIDFVQQIGSNPTLHFDPKLEPHAICSGFDVSSPELQSTIEHFFTLPWHNRIWTVQEYLQSAHIVFQCGHQTLEDATLRKCTVNLGAHGTQCCAHLLQHMPLSTQRYNALFRMANPRFDFGFMLSAFRSRSAYDPRDKVYGMLSLAPPALRALLNPDYTVSAAEVYVKLAKAMIEVKQSLDVLSHVHGTRRLEAALPSWVPDWTAEPAATDVDLFNYAGMVWGTRYRACGESLQRFVVSNDGSARTPAIVFDEVAAFENDVRSGKERLRDWSGKERLRGYHQIADLASSLGDPYASRSEAFWQTMCGGVGWEMEGSTFYSRRLLPADESAFVRWEKAVSSGTLLDNQDDFHTRNRAISKTHKFFISKKGCIGWGPIGIAKNDRIVLMPGGRVPYMLREAPGGSHCTFIGDAYVHGLMYGGGYDEAKLEPIILR